MLGQLDVATGGMRQRGTRPAPGRSAVAARHSPLPAAVHATTRCAAAELGAVGVAYVEFAVRHPSHFRVMFGPWCERHESGALPPEARPRGRDAYQILVDTLDGLVRSGAVAVEARAGAEVAAWSAVHGMAGLLVSGALPLGATERSQALGLVQRILLLGLGCKPDLLGASGKAAAAEPPAVHRRGGTNGSRAGQRAQAAKDGPRKARSST